MGKISALVIIILAILALRSFPQIIFARQLISPTPSPHPYLISTFIPSPTMRPTVTPSPTPTPTPIPTVTPKIVLKNVEQGITMNSGNSPGNYILNQINDFRKANDLSQLNAESSTCNFAQVRAKEIVGNFNHDGFDSRVASKTFPFPSYSEIVENIAMNSDYEAVFEVWKNSSGHRDNLLKGLPNGCVASEGNYYVYIGWKP